MLTRLAERVFDQVYERTQTWLHREEGEPPQAALRDAMRAALGLWREHRAVFRAMVETGPTVPEVGEAWTRMMGRFVDAATEQIDRERAAGIAPAGDSDARTLAAMLMWMVERALYLALSDGEPAFADDERLVTALTDVWCRAVYAPAPAH